MTRDEVLAMIPGRELDTCVAEFMYEKDGPFPSFSTSIEAAFEVVEFLRSNRGIGIDMITGSEYYNISADDLSRNKYGWTIVGQIECSRDNLPATICKAALLAVIE